MPSPAEPQHEHPPDADYLIQLGARIRELREARGLGLDELAARAGLHRTHLWKIEKGKLNAGVMSFIRLAQQLGTTPGELFSTSDGVIPPRDDEPQHQ